MATRSNICVKIKDGDFGRVMHFNAELLKKVGKGCNEKNLNNIEDVVLDKDYIQVYHHWDGYPDGIGMSLQHTFNSYEQALNLCLGGHISTLNGDDVEYYALIDYDGRNEEWENCKPELLDEPSLDEEYLYKFEDGKWMVKASWDDNCLEWTDLDEAIKKSFEDMS